jgi:peptidoglycan/LPS O-acetylase OafA/YrhL
MLERRTAYADRGVRDRAPHLDGLRGVAAAIVFFSHLVITLFPAVITFSTGEVHTRFDAALGISPLAMLWSGNFAVCIFFVLSGYVLSDFCISSRIGLPAQLVRRYLRLALPMLMTSFIAWALLALHLYKNYDASQVTRSGWLSLWYNFPPSFIAMASEALWGAFERGSAVYNSNLWTMRYELIGSAYVFLLHAVFKQRIARLVAMAWFGWLNLESYYVLFAAGALLHDYGKEFFALADRTCKSPRARDLIAAVLFVVGAFLGSFPYVQPGQVAIWHAWLSHSTDAEAWHRYGSVILFSGLLGSTHLQRVFSSAVPTFLGRISFVLYLVHIPLICCVTAWIVWWLGYPGAYYPPLAAVAGVATVAVVLLSAWGLTDWVDVRTTAFSRNVGTSLESFLSSRNP